jgi:uncharacterized protein
VTRNSDGTYRAVLRSVRDFPPEAWDGLASNADFYHSRWWLEYAERTTDADTAYVALQDRGEWIAALPTWVHQPGGNPMFEPARLLPELGLPRARYLVAGPQKAYRCQLLRPAGPVLPDAVVTALVEDVRAVARAHDALPIALYADGATVRALGARLPDRTPLLVDADAAIPIPESFDDYLGTLSSKRRVNIRRELREFAEQGYETDAVRLSECFREVAPLVVNLERKYGSDVTVETMTEYLRLQAELYDHHTTVITARMAGSLRATCVLYEHPRRQLTARMAGFDYEKLRNAFEYYNLCVYLPLRYGMANGYRSLHLGVSAAGAKAARGATLEPLYALDLGDTPLWGQDAARAWNRAALDRFRSEVVVAPSALTGPPWRSVPG